MRVVAMCIGLLVSSMRVCAITDWNVRGQARDCYEEGITTVMTVRDFSQIFDAYAHFEESMITAKLEVQQEAQTATPTEWEDNLDIDLRMRFARFEALLLRRPLLLNSVLLRQNPNNVHEWQKRCDIYIERELAEEVVLIVVGLCARA